MANPIKLFSYCMHFSRNWVIDAMEILYAIKHERKIKWINKTGEEPARDITHISALRHALRYTGRKIDCFAIYCWHQLHLFPIYKT